jgi:hypothetical protein
MQFIAFAIGCFALVMTGRALVVGNASTERKSITRKEQPRHYWFVIAFGILMTGFFFYHAWKG